jgi:hypothetical protein
MAAWYTASAEPPSGYSVTLPPYEERQRLPATLEEDSCDSVILLPPEELAFTSRTQKPSGIPVADNPVRFTSAEDVR